MGNQTGVAGTRRTRSGKAWPAISDCIGGRSFYAFSQLLRLALYLPHCLQAVPTLFLLDLSLLPALSISSHLSVVSVSLPPLYVPRLVWCGGFGAVDKRKKHYHTYPPCLYGLIVEL